LNKDLTDLASAIVLGTEPTSVISTEYKNYSSKIAIEVYRNNYRGNLHDALAGAYPVIMQLVGGDFFRHLARNYIAQFPSRSGNLHQYGGEMAEFLSIFEPAQDLVYLPDVATLEWACHRSYFAEDAELLDITRLAQVPPEQYANLILHVHPSCHLILSRYPVATIWHAHQPGSDKDFHIDLDKGPCNALVIRNNDQVSVNELSSAEAEWMQSILSGNALGIATAGTLERFPDFNLQTALAKLVKQGVLSDFSVSA